jgi:uncharacterized protein (TIGR00369 family)
MDFEIFSPGKLEYKIKINKNHLATPIAAHGGVISSLMDSILGICALSLVCEEEKIVSTIEMKLNFLVPVKLGDYLVGRSNLLTKGNRTIITEGEIFNQNGILVAKGMGTFNSYPKDKAGY